MQRKRETLKEEAEVVGVSRSSGAPPRPPSCLAGEHRRRSSFRAASSPVVSPVAHSSLLASHLTCRSVVRAAEWWEPRERAPPPQMGTSTATASPACSSPRAPDSILQKHGVLDGNKMVEVLAEEDASSAIRSRSPGRREKEGRLQMWKGCPAPLLRGVGQIRCVALAFFLFIMLFTMWWAVGLYRRAKYFELIPPPEKNTPMDGAVLSQLQFVSCNRQDFSQSYWSTMAQVASAERFHSLSSFRTSTLAPSSTGAACTAVPAPPLEAFIWLGDIIYSDKPLRGGPPPPSRDSFHRDLAKESRNGMLTEEEIRFRYQPAPLYPLAAVQSMWETQFRAEAYTAFRTTCVAAPKDAMRERHSSRSTTNVWGVWDDHDMGQNDAGNEYPWKNVTQRFLFDFLQVPESDPRRQRLKAVAKDGGAAGVYTFHTVSVAEAAAMQQQQWNQSDAERKSSDSGKNTRASITLVWEALELLYEHLFCVLLLDIRSFRDPANVTRSGDMLGDPQWKWVASILKEYYSSPSQTSTASPSQRHVGSKSKCYSLLIGGGIQFLLDEKITEHWGSYPRSRDYLLHLLRQHHVERAVFLTGDVHFAEFGADFTSSAIEHALGYPIVEGTSSGLTHSAESTVTSVLSRRYRDGNSPPPFHVMKWLLPSMFPTSRRVGLFVGKNFGSIKLEVGKSPAELRPEQQQQQQHALDVLQKQLEILRPGLERERGGNSSASNVSHSTLSHDQPSEEEQRRVRRSAQELRDAVDALVHLTLSIFSLDEELSSTEVYPASQLLKNRLTFPLSMLTYAGGAAYREATVDPHKGVVVPPEKTPQRAPSASSLPSYVEAWPEWQSEENSSEATTYNTYAAPTAYQYPTTFPLPRLTRIVQWCQARYFPDERMLFIAYVAKGWVLDWGRGVLLVVVLLLTVVVGMRCLVLRQWGGTSSSANPTRGHRQRDQRRNGAGWWWKRWRHLNPSESRRWTSMP